MLLEIIICNNFTADSQRVTLIVSQSWHKLTENFSLIMKTYYSNVGSKIPCQNSLSGMRLDLNFHFHSIFQCHGGYLLVDNEIQHLRIVVSILSSSLLCTAITNKNQLII